MQLRKVGVRASTSALFALYSVNKPGEALSGPRTFAQSPESKENILMSRPLAPDTHHPLRLEDLS